MDEISEISIYTWARTNWLYLLCRIKRSEGQTYKLEKCDSNGTIIVCTAENIIEKEDNYTLIDLQGFDTYIFEAHKEKKLKSKISSNILG